MTEREVTPLRQSRRPPAAERAAIRTVLLPALVDQHVVSMTRFCSELASELARLGGVSVTVARDGVGPPWPRWLPRRAAHASSRFLWYPAMARRLEGDVFHVLDHGYAHLAAVMDRRRLIVTCHDLIPLRAHVTGAPFGVPATTVAWYRLAVGALRYAAHVACVSEATRRDVISLVGVDPNRVSVVTSGVNERFRPLSAHQRREIRSAFPDGARLLLHVSSGAPYKNVEGAISVLACLRRAGNNALLLRVGPPLTSEQASVAKLHDVARQVVELGSVSEDRLVELYNAVDTVIVPSYWEGFGWPVVEALACGTPTVISDCPPLLEAAAGAAVAGPPGEPNAFAQAVLRVWSSPELRQTLRAAGIRRAASLTWRRAAEQYLGLYEQVATQARNPGFG